MKLLERYATMLGLQIGKQHFEEQFYPLPFQRYMTLHASSGMVGKNYPLYAEVVALIKPYLGDIEIVQIGINGDPAIPGCHHLLGKTTIHQDNHVLARSLLHLANDSVYSHRAGYLGIPLVETFATTSVENHSPYTFNKEKTRFVSSHRWGRNPTFASQEAPSTALLIDPFTVARAVLDLLGIAHTITQRSLHVGHTYNASVLDWIPNVGVAPTFNPDLPLVPRMDIHHDESVLTSVLQTGRKVNIVTKAPINLDILAAFRAQIQSYNHEVDENTPLDYVLKLKKVLQNLTFFSRTKDEAELSRIRFRFFDVVNVQQLPHKTRADFEKASAEYQNRPPEDVKIELDQLIKSGMLRFKTQKFVLSKGKMYLSLAHAAADIPMEGNNQVGTVLDDGEWYRDMNHWFGYA